MKVSVWAEYVSGMSAVKDKFYTICYWVGISTKVTTRKRSSESQQLAIEHRSRQVYVYTRKISPWQLYTNSNMAARVFSQRVKDRRKASKNTLVYTGVLGSFRRVGDDGDVLSKSPSEIHRNTRPRFPFTWFNKKFVPHDRVINDPKLN